MASCKSSATRTPPFGTFLWGERNIPSAKKSPYPKYPLLLRSSPPGKMKAWIESKLVLPKLGALKLNGSRRPQGIPKKALGDVGMHELKRQLEYKAAWYGREFRQVDRFVPTSKTCSVCGAVQKAMPLKVREWTCSDCQTAHDRDINAARNILRLATVGRTGSDARLPVRDRTQTGGGVYPLEVVP